MAVLISPRRMERIVDENGFPTLRFIEYLERNTTNTNNTFTESFISSEQTITAAGLLVLPHALSSSPELIQARIICKAAEHDYSIGDEIIIHPLSYASSVINNYGMGVTVDSTNITIRYGATPNVLFIAHKTTGISASITSSKWRLIIRAWS